MSLSSRIGKLFGLTRVIMFIPADYIEDFRMQVLSHGFIKDPDIHATTTKEAEGFGIKNSAGLMSVVAVVNKRNKKRLSGLKAEFDTFVIEDKRKKISESRARVKSGNSNRRQKSSKGSKDAARKAKEKIASIKVRREHTYRA